MTVNLMTTSETLVLDYRNITKFSQAVSWYEISPLEIIAYY